MFGKKRTFSLFALLLIVALFLSACAGGNNAANDAGEVPQTGEEVLETPGIVVEETPEIVVEETPEVIVEETPEVVVEETEVVVEETPEVVVEETPVEGEEGGVVAGEGLQCNPYRLSNILDYRVVTNDAVDLGEVNAVVVQRAGNSAYGIEEGVLEGEVDEAAEDAALTGITMPVNAPAPMASYIIVDINDDSLEALNVEDGDMLLPFSAIQMNAVGAENEALLEDGTCGFTLSLASADLETAPVLENDAWNFTEEGWNTEVNTFAQNLALNVPTLGEGVATNVTVFEDGIFDQIDIDVENLEDEDLGEIEDFIIDTQTGNFRYGILETGEFLGLGGESIPVPMNHMVWVNEDDVMEDLGEIILPMEQAEFENAPVIGDLGTINFGDETWDDEYETYWTGLGTE